MSKDIQFDPTVNAISGSASSALALAIIYPMDTQVQNSHHTEQYKGIFDGIKKITLAEGVSALYSGLGPNLINQSLSGYIYFYFYAYLKNRYTELVKIKNGSSLPTPIELSIGVLSGVFGQCITLPINLISSRQQMSSGGNSKSVYSIISDIYKTSGLLGFWKGFGPSIILCTNPAITYGLFEKIKQYIIRRKIRSGAVSDIDSAFLTSIEAFVAGALSKVAATVITYPYISAKVRLMYKPTKEEIEKFGDDVVYSGTLDVLKKLLRIYGIQGWYMGMRVHIIKSLFTQALVLMFKEFITKLITQHLLKSRKKLL
ncbi:hypothetical protein BB561_002836 [Smittium simulii]|uniref:Uncharacterized protein n=1 Tax=Smittium simulii TaxID=133385 RepID=A0A2T9YNW0_9FUNG|nr:hypothetical protein BB561_002836 [Smittium simulii]